MRNFSLLLLLLTAAAWSQQAVDTYGKTEAEILAMGMDKWSDFYSSKVGSSTADMVSAGDIYGRISKARTDRILAKSSSAVKARTTLLRKAMRDFGTSAINVGYQLSGGGTMWNPVWAAVSGETEDALYPILIASNDSTKAIVVSTVLKRMDKIKGLIERERKDPSYSEFFKYGEAKKALAEMSTKFKVIVATAAHMRRADSNRLLLFCFHYAEVSIPN